MFLKTEILLTRQCSVGCSYCRMVRKKNHSMPLSEWEKVLTVLKNWDVRFLAIYGAEPTEYPYFLDFLDLVKQGGWGKSSTVITAGHNPEIIKKAVDIGLLDSLTVSWDFGRTKKDNSGYQLCKDLYGRVTDIEISATIFENTTVEQIEYLVEEASKIGAWLSFDMCHSNTQNHLWSKVPKGKERTSFNDSVIKRMLELKSEGAKIHQSMGAIELCKSSNPLWRCIRPTFFTVNCDGVPMVCDDFGYSGKKLYDFKDEAEYREWWYKEQEGCLGCKWTTHFMSEEMFNVEGVTYFAHGRV